MRCQIRGPAKSKALVLTLLAGCLAGLAGCDRLERSANDASSVVGKRILFGKNGGSEVYRTKGWSQTEDQFTWTEGTAAKLSFPIGSQKGALTFRAMASAFIKPPELLSQPLEVVANGKTIAQWEVSNAAEFSATVPAEVVKAGDTLEIELRTPKAVSPKALGQSEDNRVLGACVHWLELVKP
jgi:hypothetical protein